MATKLGDIWVQQLAADMEKGTPNFSQAKRIMELSGPINVEPIVKYIDSKTFLIKDIAIKLVAIHGDPNIVARILMKPMDYKKSLELLRLIGKRDNWDIKIIIPLLKSPFSELKIEAVKVIKEQGEEDDVLSAIAMDNPQLYEKLKDLFK